MKKKILKRLIIYFALFVATYLIVILAQHHGVKSIKPYVGGFFEMGFAALTFFVHAAQYWWILLPALALIAFLTAFTRRRKDKNNVENNAKPPSNNPKHALGSAFAGSLLPFLPIFLMPFVIQLFFSGYRASEVVVTLGFLFCLWLLAFGYSFAFLKKTDDAEFPAGENSFLSTLKFVHSKVKASQLDLALMGLLSIGTILCAILAIFGFIFWFISCPSIGCILAYPAAWIAGMTFAYHFVLALPRIILFAPVRIYCNLLHRSRTQ